MPKNVLFGVVTINKARSGKTVVDDGGLNSEKPPDITLNRCYIKLVECNSDLFILQPIKRRTKKNIKKQDTTATIKKISKNFPRK